MAFDNGARKGPSLFGFMLGCSAHALDDEPHDLYDPCGIARSNESPLLAADICTQGCIELSVNLWCARRCTAAFQAWASSGLVTASWMQEPTITQYHAHDILQTVIMMRIVAQLLSRGHAGGLSLLHCTFSMVKSVN